MSGIANRLNLTGVKTLPLWPSNGKKFVPDPDSTDVIIAPPPAADVAYWGFPDLDINPINNDIYLIYARAVAHSGGGLLPGVGTYIQKSTDGALSFDEAIYTLDANIYGVGGPTLGITPTGRFLTFHTDFANSQGLGDRQPFFRHSDSGLEMEDFTTIAHLTTDYPSPGAVYGPGKAIRYQGVMLKPMYGRSTVTGNRGIFIYKSIDNGGSWSFHGTVIHEANPIADYEEPYLVPLPNGILRCTIKSETLDISLVSYSLNGGVHWSEPKFLMNSEGKNGIVCSPSNTLLAVGRKFPSTDWRIIYTSSPDMGNTWDTEAYADERTDMFMYAGGVWHPGRNKAIVAYGADENFPTGPCKIIIKTFSEVNI